MKHLTIPFVLMLSALAARSQIRYPLTPDSALSFFNENFPQEKIYMQTDRTQYISGETIWMKTWCTHSGVPTFLSNIFYVDLLNKEGKVIQKKMYRLDSMSSAAPSIDIPGTAESGNYILRGYTLWMLNFPDYIFKKPLYIYNNDYRDQKNSKKTETSLSVVFFPEGGDLIAGVKNRLAFKAVNQKGLPENIKGFVKGSNNEKILDFKSEHDGLGAFELTPESGKQYIAVLSDDKGNKSEVKIPASKEEGISINIINNNAGRLFVMLNRAESNKEKYNDLRVTAQMNSQIVFDAKVNIDAGENTVAIGKKNLPAGIMQITVFTNEGMPLSERIVFIENYTVVKPSVTWNLLDIKARKKNELSFQCPDTSETALSILVTDVTLDTAVGSDENIISSLLATSDLRGYVHNPGYYFINKSAERLQHLDLLLMTQGWRRFAWNSLLKNEFPVLHYPVESAMSISGRVTKSDRTEVVKDGYVSFIIKGEDSSSLLADASVTDKGEFLLSNINFIKKATIFYMGTNKKKDGYIVDVNIFPSYIDSLSTSLLRPSIDLEMLNSGDKKTSLSSYLSDQLFLTDTSDKRNKSLEVFTVKAKKLSKEDSLNREYTEGPFQFGKSIDPADYKFSRTIWQIIQQAVPGVSVEGNPFNPRVTFSRFAGMGPGAEVDEATGLVLEEDGIAYFINGINVSKDEMNTVAVSDVALVKVYKNEAAALGASQGAIAIYTRKGIVAGKKPYEKTYTSYKKEGYAVVREFYSPDYDLNPGLDKEATDNRYTLYFGGRIRPYKDGKYHIHFFNNDISKKIKILIQGITRDGHFIYDEQTVGAN